MTRKPPLNPGCEAIKGWDTDSSGKPFLIRCWEPGVERPDVIVLKWATILCDICYASICARREAKADAPVPQVGPVESDTH